MLLRQKILPVESPIIILSNHLLSEYEKKYRKIYLQLDFTFGFC